MNKDGIYTCTEVHHLYGWDTVRFTIDGTARWEFVISTVEASIFEIGKKYRITVEEVVAQEG